MPNTGLVTMPLSLINRLPPGTDGGRALARPEEDRRTEYLRKFSANSKRLRGALTGSLQDVNKRGRVDSLEAMTLRGIIPIHVHQTNPYVTLHGVVQCYAPNRAPSAETITATPGGAFVKGNPAVDTTFGATGVQDLTAVDSLDTNAQGKARYTIA